MERKVLGTSGPGRRWRVGSIGSMTMSAVLGLGCASAGEPPIDLVIDAGAVVTLDSTHPRARSVAVGGGRIVAVADSAPPARWLAGQPEVVVVPDGVVAPALIDHHTHLFNIGMALYNRREGGRVAVDLNQVRSLAELQELVRRRAAETKPGGWVLGQGWSQATWGSGALPTADMLDRAAGDRPTFLTRIDGHAGWLNHAGMRLAGIGAGTLDPDGGRIVRDREGRPTGVLLERANELVTRLLPPLEDAVVTWAYRLATQALADRGVVETDDLGPLAFPGVVALSADFERHYRLLARLDSASGLPIRVNLAVPAPSPFAESLLVDRTRPLERSPRVRVTRLKLFADGALGSRGASLSHPYADDSTTRGVPRMTVEAITELTRRAVDRGLGVATHAIGDDAVRRTLDGYQAVLRDRPGLAPGRLRIDHLSYASKDDMARAARLGVVLSVQSNGNAAPDEEPTFGAVRVGAANEDRVYAWQTLASLGARLVEGSDYFTAPDVPLAGFLASLTRRYTVGAGLPDSLGRIAAYRVNASRIDGEGRVIPGAIRVGDPADLVVWSADPFTVPRTAIAGVRVIRLVAGRP